MICFLNTVNEFTRLALLLQQSVSAVAVEHTKMMNQAITTPSPSQYLTPLGVFVVPQIPGRSTKTPVSKVCFDWVVFCAVNLINM